MGKDAPISTELTGLCKRDGQACPARECQRDGQACPARECRRDGQACPALGIQPLFDYRAELASARAGEAAMFKRLGIPAPEKAVATGPSGLSRRLGFPAPQPMPPPRPSQEASGTRRDD